MLDLDLVLALLIGMLIGTLVMFINYGGLKRTLISINQRSKTDN